MITDSTKRHQAAAKFVRAQLERTATVLDEAEGCDHARANNALVAIELRRLARIVMGDIGKPEEQEEWEVEPLEIPQPAPAPVPA